ncbi:MAG: hypothetical protein V7784_17740 [Oceanospirillaceae bacterium]
MKAKSTQLINLVVSSYTNIFTTSKLLITIFVLFLPIALMAFTALPNEYAAQGIISAVDCDGPISVIIFAIPSYLVYGFLLVRFTLLAFTQSTLGYLSLIICCCFIVLIITPNVSAAFQERNKTAHLKVCGEGW